MKNTVIIVMIFSLALLFNHSPESSHHIHNENCYDENGILICKLVNPSNPNLKIGCMFCDD